jgi:hypothetical protein
MLSLAGALAFLGFLLALAGVRRAERRGPSARRAAIELLLLYALGASFAAGLARRDAWPFSHWPMAAGLASARGENTRLLALDAEGREWAVDARAWQPLGFDELNPWMHRSFARLSPDARQRVLAHLLAVAEQARRRARSGDGVGYFDRYLGPLTAPAFDLHPRVWSAGEGTPAEPFAGLRVYRESWDHEQRRRRPDAVERRLVDEHPRR